MTPDLTTLPAIRELAVERAREYVRVGSGWPGDQCWDRMLSASERQAQVNTHLALLADLTRPASRDEIARLVGERIGWDAFDVTKAIDASAAMLAGLYRVAGLPELPRWEPVPPPAEALAAVALAVLR